MIRRTNCVASPSKRAGPKALAVPDLLLALTAPKNPNYFGSYQLFLRRLVEKLTDEELVDLVRAVAAPVVAHDQTVGDVAWVDEDDLDPAMPVSPFSVYYDI
jgi:hypothetical protein